MIDGLEDVFSATTVVNMDTEKLHTLGRESEQTRAERLELEQKVTALQDAQRECLRAGKVQTLNNIKLRARNSMLTITINIRSDPRTSLL